MKQKGQQGFAARLRALMIERGHTSSASRSGVDVNALSAAASTSYEMARRYAQGMAVPRPDKLEAIALWLGVSPAALMWGDETHTIDAQVLESCVIAVQEAQDRTRISLSTNKAAHLVAILYQEAMAGRRPEARTVDLLLRAV